jgi:hypothetical protein
VAGTGGSRQAKLRGRESSRGAATARVPRRQTHYGRRSDRASFVPAEEEARASPVGAPCCHSKDHLLMSSSTLTWRMVPWRLEHWLTSGSRATTRYRGWHRAWRVSYCNCNCTPRRPCALHHDALFAFSFIFNGWMLYTLSVSVPRSRRLMQCLRRINDS